MVDEMGRSEAAGNLWDEEVATRSVQGFPLDHYTPRYINHDAEKIKL